MQICSTFTKKVKKSIPLETIKKIYNYTSDVPQIAMAKGMWLFAYFAIPSFMFSYFKNGMSFTLIPLFSRNQEIFTSAGGKIIRGIFL